MSYASLLASAESYWPAQEGSGSLIDSVAAVSLAPVGSPSYAVAGPTAWLPRGALVHVMGSFQSAVYAGLNLAGSFTVASWIRLPAPSAGFQSFLSLVGDRPQFGFVNAEDMFYQFIPFSFNVSGPKWDSPVWAFGSYRRNVAVPEFVFGRNANFNAVSTGTQSPGVGLLGVGVPNSAYVVEFAGLGIWRSFLSDSDIASLVAGPVAGTGGLRRRGGGKVRRPRR